jgi:hypothetical protein
MLRLKQSAVRQIVTKDKKNNSNMKYNAVLICGVVMALLGAAASAPAQPASINGAYDPAFGSALSIQTDATGFGLNDSELDAAYGLITNGTLYLFFSGNLQNNGNNLNVFIAGTNGQGTLAAASLGPGVGEVATNSLSIMNGSKFSPGFTAIYAININNTNVLNVSQYNLLADTAVDALGTNLTESGNIVSNKTIDNSVIVGFNNNNTQSQAADVGTGSLGMELAIPLSLLGNPSGAVEVMADINGAVQGYLSNQFFPGLASGTANLGTGTFNFSSTAGEYFTVPGASGGVTVVSSAPTASAITYGQTLASSTLSGGAATNAAGATVGGSFAFTTPSTVPGAGTNSESVTFSPSDTTDYSSATVNVNVTVNQQTPTLTAPTASAIPYGQTLASSTLSGGAATNAANNAAVAGSFAFTTPSTAPGAGTNSESVTFSPSDTTDYTTATVNVNVTVNQPGQQTPTLTAPTASAITYGQTLANSTLSGGAAADPTDNAPVGGSFAFTTPSTVPGAGMPSESVTFTPTDTTDYTTATTSVPVTVNQQTPTLTAPTASAIPYGQTLASSTLSGGAATNAANNAAVAGGFAFTTPSTAPGVGTNSESVTLSPADTTDYSSATVNVNVTVNQQGTNGPPVLSINGINGNHGVTHVFVNEVSNDAVPLTILFSPNTSTNVVEADVFSNLNRRNYANVLANGVPEGILPPNPNTIATGDTNDYYEAYPMTTTGTPGQYSLTLYAQQTGAYRLTARYMVAGSTNWNWYSINTPYSTSGNQDFMVVVSPKRAMSMVLYELAVNTIDAKGPSLGYRSTFTDLYNGPGSFPYNSQTNFFNLNYVTNMGVNWLWIEPMHPIGVLDTVNSPYCVKDFFQVSPYFSKADTESGGMTEFQGFVAAANAAGVNIMLDEPFDHTSHDCEMETEGVTDFGGVGNSKNFKTNDLISADVPQFYSPSNSYCTRAITNTIPEIALAPDEGQFAKWTDVIDVFHGVSAARVCENPANNNNYETTEEWFDYTTNTGSFDNITENVWIYFADQLLYWLNQSGCTNGTPANQTANLGIGGIRADFAEGLPPQCWEYIMNTVRCQKWDFVFLAESLDGGNPTLRSSRDFDIVDDSILYSFRTNTISTQYNNDFISEGTNYNQCPMMWNVTSHDVGFYYTDPYQALLRYMIGGTIYGCPHMLYGQEMGTTSDFGFSLYSVSGTEYVPDFYTFNSLQPAYVAAIGNLRVDQLYPLYSAVAKARQSSTALQSPNRLFLNPYTTSKPGIFAVGKFAVTNGAPNFNDVVFGFVNVAYTNTESGNFDVNISANGTNIYGIQSGRTYNVKNIAAYLAVNPNRSSNWFWTNGIAGSTLLTTGVPVSLNSVPTNSLGWTNAPYEAQYLKLYDVTPPPTPSAPGIGSTNNYVLTNVVTFTWTSVTDSIGGVSGYQVIVGSSPGASDVFSGIVQGTTLTVTNVYGATLYAEVSAINNAGIQGTASASSAGVILVNPGTIPVLSMQPNYVLSWTSVSNLNYQVFYTTNLSMPFTAVSGVITAVGPTTQYTNTSPDPQGFYQVQLIP